jgi:hypothetical protein
MLNNNDKKIHLIFAGLSGAVYLILKLILKNIKHNFVQIKETKPQSVKEIFKNSKNLKENTFVLLSGKLDRSNGENILDIYNNERFYIRDINEKKLKCSNKLLIIPRFYAAYYNPRVYNYNVVNLFLGLYNPMSTRLYLSEARLLYYNIYDQLVIPGRLTKYPTLHLDTEQVCRGNKLDLLTLLKENIYCVEAYATVSLLFCFYHLLCVGLSYFAPITETVIPLKCSSCKIRSVNVVLNECNHFQYCRDCFYLKNKICPVCKFMSRDYNIVNFK